MRKNKIGALFAVSFLALAGIGISYAGWHDVITISGSVQTGDVSWEIVEFSGTWVYKIKPHGILRNHQTYLPDYTEMGDDPGGNPGGIVGDGPVARAWAEPGDDPNSVNIHFENLFPCQDFTADFVVKYTGSIPARVAGSHYITTSDIDHGDHWETYGPIYAGEGANWLEDLWACYQQNPDAGYGIWITAYKMDCPDCPDGNGDGNGGALTIGEGDNGNGDEVDNQVHNGDCIYFSVTIHIPNNEEKHNAYQNCSGSFSLDLFALQWDVFDAEIDDFIKPPE